MRYYPRVAKSPRLTVGSLLGVPQFGSPAPERRASSLGGWLRPAPPSSPKAVAPARRGKGCCRSGCAGCPWTEAMRRRSALG